MYAKQKAFTCRCPIIFQTVNLKLSNDQSRHSNSMVSSIREEDILTHHSPSTLSFQG